MATEIAGNMSKDDKDSMESMDIEKMISHVTKNMFKMMGNTNEGGNARIEEIDESSKTEDLCFNLEVSLEELYNGKKKKINVKVNRLNAKGEPSVVKKKLTVDILPGMVNGETITFVGESDELDGKVPGDIIITLVEKEHLLFKREGNNLIVNKAISVSEIFDLNFSLTHLDSRVISIRNSGNLGSLEKKIVSEGMPLLKKRTRGDLIIKFNILLPLCKKISDKDIKNLKKIFGVGILLTENVEKYDSIYNLNSKDSDDSDNSDLESSDSGSVNSSNS